MVLISGFRDVFLSFQAFWGTSDAGFSLTGDKIGLLGVFLFAPRKFSAHFRLTLKGGEIDVSMYVVQTTIISDVVIVEPLAETLPCLAVQEFLGKGSWML